MRKDPRTTAAPPMAYQLPEVEYRALLRARDRLRLLANLGTPDASGEDQESPLLPPALTQWVVYLADDLDDIVRGVWWPEQQAGRP